MKKILIITLGMLFFSNNIINAQKRVAISGYANIGYTGDGYLRYPKEDSNDPVFKEPYLTFVLRSKEKGFEIQFKHYNFNLVELAKERPVDAEDRRMYEYGSIYGNYGNYNMYYNVYDLLELSKEELWKLAQEWRIKMLNNEIRLYVEDWRFRIMKETNICAPQYYEVRYIWDNEPEPEKESLSDEHRQLFIDYMQKVLDGTEVIP